MPPTGISAETDKDKLIASFDGDCDRVVFHGFQRGESGDAWVLLDGDAIACLFAKFIIEEMRQTDLLHSGSDDCSESSNKFSVGVVQTAYANGASTVAMKEMYLSIFFAFCFTLNQMRLCLIGV